MPQGGRDQQHCVIIYWHKYIKVSRQPYLGQHSYASSCYSNRCFVCESFYVNSIGSVQVCKRFVSQGDNVLLQVKVKNWILGDGSEWFESTASELIPFDVKSYLTVVSHSHRLLQP